jgi:ankyrin repeat protein
MLRVSLELTKMKKLTALAASLCIAYFTFAQDLYPTLSDAARTHDLGEVRKLLAQGADPNKKEKNGRTPLMEAAACGYTDTIRVLLENGADVYATDMVGWTALFWAAFSRRTEAMRLLVAKGADINANDNEKKSALFWVASSGDTDTVKTLLEMGAKANAKDSHGWTPLMIAAYLGHLDTVRVLVEKGADVQVRDKDGNTAKSLAEKYKFNEIVVVLKSASRSPQKRITSTPSGSSPAIGSSSSAGAPAQGTKNSNAASIPATPPAATPALPKNEMLNERLLQAAESGDTTEVLNLIREGAGVNAVGATYGNTALMKAAARGYTNTVRALLEKGGEVDARDNAGRTALMEAAFGGYTDTAGLLLEKGANVNASDAEGWTPLFWAAFSRRSGTVRLLLEKGADVNAKNKHEDSPLIHAAYAGDTETVGVLLEHQVEVNAKDDMGRTALIEAARQGHTDIVRLLLENGASADLQARDGSAALALATQQRHTEIVALLKNPPQSAGPKGGAEKTSKPAEPPAGSVANPDLITGEMQRLQKKARTRAFYGLGLSMSFLEELWPKTDQEAERAAATVLGNLRKVGGPEDLIELAQRTSTRLSFPTEENKEPIQPLIVELRNRLDTYCLSQADGKFFYEAGSFTYELNLLGENLSKADHGNASIEDTRRTLLALANNFAARCATITECKERGLGYLSDAANVLKRSPLVSADGKTLQTLANEIGVALGTEDMAFAIPSNQSQAN